MKILAIGGTNFIGPPVVRQLVAAGHELTLFHRGKTEADLPEGVQHILGDRTSLHEFRQQFEQLAPQVVLDLIPYTERDAKALVSTCKGIAQRVVAISSQDVYRVYDILRGLDDAPAMPVPLTEDAPLRSHLYPYKDFPQRPLNAPEDYEKILVEKVILSEPELPATILRLPMVYGSGDPLHRLFPYLKRMDEKRPAIVLTESYAQWRGCWGYVENVAAAIALAVTSDRAASRTYNVAEPSSLSEAERLREVGHLAGWKGEVVVVPDSQMPSEWQLPYNTEQHWVSDSSRIRSELGYVEPIPREKALQRTIHWERRHPPEEISPWSNPFLLDYETEDKLV